jgi:hypothetical protein
MSIDVTASLRIEAPPSAVAAIEFDPSRDPEWIGGVNRVEYMTPPPLGLHTQVRRSGGFLGRPIEWIMRIDALEPDQHVGMHALKSPFPMDVDYVLEVLDGGRATQASIRIRGEGRGMYGLPGPLLGPMIRRSVTGDLRRLKRIVEQGNRGVSS